MKKFLLIAAVFCLFSGTVQAKIDIVSVAQQAQDHIDAAQNAVETTKDSAASTKEVIEQNIDQKLTESRENVKNKIQEIGGETDTASSDAKNAAENLNKDAAKVVNELNTLKSVLTK